MQERRGEKRGWMWGWLGGFSWVLILSILFLSQGKVLQAALGLVLVGAAGAAIVLLSPWRHPGVTYRRLMVPIYVLIFVSVAWGVWGGEGLKQMGFHSPWAFLMLMPVLTPLWTVGHRKWREDVL